MQFFNQFNALKLPFSKALLIAGPKIDTNNFFLIPKIAKIYSKLDLKKINFHETNNIIMYFHGYASVKGLHLVSVNEGEHPEYTHICFKKIQSHHPFPLNIELLSCRGGLAINNINYLNEGSTLITSTSSENACNSSKNFELILSTYLFIGNPFIKFIANILNNPDDNSFAINLGKDQYYIFHSNLEELSNYSDENLKEFKKNELYKFKLFLQSIPNTNFIKINDDLKNTINFLSDYKQIDHFLSMTFHPTRYKEQILLNCYFHKNSIDVVKKLIKFGVDINTKNLFNYSLLTISANYGFFELVEFLLNNKADPNITDHNGITPLSSACHKGYFKIVKILLDYGADPNKKTYDSTSCLNIASKGNYTEIVKILLKHNADPLIANNDGLLPIKTAIYNENDEIIDLLNKYTEKILISPEENSLNAIKSNEINCYNIEDNQDYFI